ncbi:Ran-binding-domain-containing protein [Massarina eburnea CBS 473.64]|uniref:Ran-binding-domain-containing protein n=1 Tax=Massarina eburnea CBS 473.64 TaxID=1395130 RepID=A0A6A6RZL6_9PLEO|nr:Ran-binding-domain-containing protein [Massarina eburnea CBS 473.64]
MEVLLSQVTKQAMNYAIRTGITITSGYAIQQCGRLLKTVDGQSKYKEELASLQMRLDSKIRIISPAIDMIELIAARGNTSLESAVTLTKSLRWDIQTLGVRLSKAVGEAKLARKGSSRSKSSAQNELELTIIIAEIKKLLVRIEDAVPLINLAITTSGVSLSTSLPAQVSPSRLLQAGTFLNAGDLQYNNTMPRAQQIGPAFTLSMYMLFSGHANRPQDEEGIRNTTWKEVMHKARVTLLRVPLEHIYDYPTSFGGDSVRGGDGTQDRIPSQSRSHEFAYQLLILEDLDDDRMHTFEDGEIQPVPYEGVNMAGIREIIPIHEISKIFYADTGKILNIGADGETNNPILLLKRDVNAQPPRRMMEHSEEENGYASDDSHTVGASDDEKQGNTEEQSELDAQLRRESTAELPAEVPVEAEPDTHPWRLPPNLDLEWMAFEVYTEEPSTDSEVDESELEDSQISSPTETSQRASTESPGLTSYFSNLNLQPSTPSASTPPPHNTQLIPSPQKKSLPTVRQNIQQPANFPSIKTSLSLLEMLVRLTALQQFQQTSHLAVPDELLTFFLTDSSTVGAGGDSEMRRRVRREARARVGFDPYDESPIKRRGEEYLELYDAEHEHEHDHEHDHDHDHAFNGNTPNLERPHPHFDYEGYPSGSGHSSPRPRSSTSSHTNSPADFRHALSSASPLHRRAAGNPTQYGNGAHFRALRQPTFRGAPLTAPSTSSSPRPDQTRPGSQQMGIRRSRTPDTPPSSAQRMG